MSLTLPESILSHPSLPESKFPAKYSRVQFKFPVVYSRVVQKCTTLLLLRKAQRAAWDNSWGCTKMYNPYFCLETFRGQFGTIGGVVQKCTPLVFLRKAQRAVWGDFWGCTTMYNPYFCLKTFREQFGMNSGVVQKYTTPSFS